MRPSLAAIFPADPASIAQAASPNLGAIRPVGGQRGTEIEVDLTGARLGDAQEILFYQPGIETVVADEVADNHVKAKIKIAADCTLGLHDLRLRTATGPERAADVQRRGPIRRSNEVEPNNDFAKPQPIALEYDRQRRGRERGRGLSTSCEAKKGERISAEVEGVRLGIRPCSTPMWRSWTPSGSSSPPATTRPWSGRTRFASIIAPATASTSSRSARAPTPGNGSCLYRLHVGKFPRFYGDRARRAASSARRSRCAGSATWRGRGRSRSRCPPSTTRTSAFRAGRQGDRPLSQPFRLSPFGNVIEAEPNDDQGKATPFEPPWPSTA